MQNIIERAAVLSPGPLLTVADLPAEMRQLGTLGADTSGPSQPTGQFISLAEAIEAFKREQIQRALAESGGNQTKAALRLGLPRPNLSRLMKQLGLR